jgi:hypothetical protein
VETREQWLFWYGYDHGRYGNELPIISNDLTWSGFGHGVCERIRREKNKLKRQLKEKQKAIQAAMLAVEALGKFELTEQEKSLVIDHLFDCQKESTKGDGTCVVEYPLPKKRLVM